MRRLGVFGAAVALVVAFGASSVCAQIATSEPAGQPLSLLAGLRPPHEARHKYPKHVAHAVSRARAVHKKAAARTRHARMSAAHARHAAAKRLAERKYEHHERRYEQHEKPVTASAFAEEPQADPNPAPAGLTPTAVQPLTNAGPMGGAAAATEAAVAPIPENSAPNADAGAEPAAARVQTVKTAPPDENAVSNPAAAVSDPAPAQVASSTTATSDSAVTAPPSQTVLAAPAQKQKHENVDPVGSASWLAQVLAALGGAVTAGAVAWFLIGGGPARTYG